MSDSFIVDLLPFWAIEVMFSPIFTVITGGALILLLFVLYAAQGDPKKGFVKNFGAIMPAYVLMMMIGVAATLFAHYVFPGHSDNDRRLEELKTITQEGNIVEINGTKYVPLSRVQQR